MKLALVKVKIQERMRSNPMPSTNWSTNIVTGDELLDTPRSIPEAGMWVRIVRETDLLYMEFTPMYRNGTPELNIDGSWNWCAADWLSFEEDENLLSIVNQIFRTQFEHPDDPANQYAEWGGRSHDRE